MKVTFHDFGASVPLKPRYERGIDFLTDEFDLEFKDALYLVSNLKNNRSSLFILAPSTMVDFYISDGELNVQIEDCGPGIWCASNLDLATAEAILKAAFEGLEDFGSQIPGTDRTWDVY